MSEILDLGTYGPDFARNPYPIYAKLRDEGPVHRVRTPEGQDVWLVVGYEEARSALTDARLSKDPRTVLGDRAVQGAGALANMLESDPSQHTRLRKLVTRAFTPRRVEALRPRVQEMTDTLVDAMLGAADGRADLVEALAFPLPMSVICELLGVPARDAGKFHAWSSELIAPSAGTSAGTVLRSIAVYLTGLIEEKRVGPGDDLLSGLIRITDEDGDRLSEEELLGMAFLLLIAGHETTLNQIANGIRALLEHPEQLAALRADMSLVDNAVEEMLRYDGPLKSATDRFTKEPVEIGGTVIPARCLVLVALASADRAPEKFPEPDRFDIRRDARGHMAFGHGIHHCLGAPLARMELQIAVRTLLERCPDLALDADPDSLPWIPGALIRGARTLPVRWTPGS
ncbi:cytochrome P450 [Streptomyces cinnamoneus]|uniref:cytochrome P450 family protein n=1 Tax=Streptomyces cinnamoneus TaxID=53446 RepID=UPI0033F3D480